MVDKTLVVGGEMFNPSHPCFWKEPLASVRMSNCKINGTVHIFFLKKSYLSPRCPKLPIFFPSGYFPLYLHVIIDLGHIWGPFMAKFDKMSKKSAFLLVPDFGYPPVVGAFVTKCWT